MVQSLAVKKRLDLLRWFEADADLNTWLKRIQRIDGLQRLGEARLSKVFNIKILED